MGFLARGKSSSQSHWVSICMSFPFVCAHAHIICLLNNVFVGWNTFEYAYMCILSCACALVHIYSSAHVCACDRESKGLF